MRGSSRALLSWIAVSAWVTLSTSAGAVGLTVQSESTPWPGVVVKKYRTSSPATNAWAAFVDLCAPGIHVDATRYSGSFQATGAWANGRGVQLATNGDFFKASPTRVYGQAVGEGVPWPSIATGFDPAHSGEWYYRRAGWIGFGFDGVTFGHTERVKLHPPEGVTLGGFRPDEVTGELPPGILAVVSGFPELVTEGSVVTCADPTASTCFPDRSDMRARHPRTAMGIDEAGTQLILLVVDGRTSSSAGMYGTELAETMSKLGAWQAMNLDGGGSSQFWQRGKGYLNDTSGNNNGAGLRSVLNHWGVFAGTNDSVPARPGHCATATACGVVPASGGTIDDDSACFRTFGNASTWRTESLGQGGSLRWTNAMKSARADNWAWWQLHLEAAGDYDLEVYLEPEFSQFSSTRYEVLASGEVTELEIDQSASSGWTKLGTFRLAAGGGQYVRVFDNHPTVSVASGTHVSADALRVTPVAPACGDGACNGEEQCGDCAIDCGACPACGDGACEQDESCATCADDCGACPLCGDGVCDANETCTSCPSDCGACGEDPLCEDCATANAGSGTGSGAGGSSEDGSESSAEGCTCGVASTNQGTGRLVWASLAVGLAIARRRRRGSVAGRN